MKPNPFVTVAEAARILGVTARTVRRMVEAGRLRCVKASERRRYLYRAEVNDLDATRKSEDLR